MNVDKQDKMVKVTWEDAKYRERWQTTDEIDKDKPCILESYGRVVVNNKSKIVIIGERDFSDGMVRYTTSIPKKYVRSIEIFHKE